MKRVADTFGRLGRGEFLDNLLRQSLPCFTIGRRVGIGLFHPMSNTPSVEPTDRISTRMVGREGLPEEHPQRDDRRVNPISKTVAKLLANLEHLSGR